MKRMPVMWKGFFSSISNTHSNLNAYDIAKVCTLLLSAACIHIPMHDPDLRTCKCTMNGLGFTRGNVPAWNVSATTLNVCAYSTPACVFWCYRMLLGVEKNWSSWHIKMWAHVRASWLLAAICVHQSIRYMCGGKYSVNYILVNAKYFPVLPITGGQ